MLLAAEKAADQKERVVGDEAAAEKIHNVKGNFITDKKRALSANVAAKNSFFVTDSQSSPLSPEFNTEVSKFLITSPLL